MQACLATSLPHFHDSTRMLGNLIFIYILGALITSIIVLFSSVDMPENDKLSMGERVVMSVFWWVTVLVFSGMGVLQLRDRVVAWFDRREPKDDCVFCRGAKGGTPGNESLFDGKPVCDYCTVLLHDVVTDEQRKVDARRQQANRFEVIDHRAASAPQGRVFTAYDCKIETFYQDGGRTLKVFVDDREPA